MGKQTIDGIIAIVTAIIGLAILGVLVSNGSNTASVITSAGNTLSSVLKAATGSLSSSSGALTLPSLGGTSSPGLIGGTVASGGLE